MFILLHYQLLNCIYDNYYNCILFLNKNKFHLSILKNLKNFKSFSGKKDAFDSYRDLCPNKVDNDNNFKNSTILINL